MATLTIIGNRFAPRPKSVSIVGQVNAEQVTFVVDESWDGLELQAQFFNSADGKPVPMALDETMTCYVPADATAQPGMVYVALAGYDDGVVVKLTEKLYYSDAKDGADPDGGIPPEEQTPSYLNQIKQILNETKEVAQSVRDDADQGKFDGPPGKSPEIRNGTWWVWDIEAQDWVDTGVAASGGGSGGTTDYNELTNKPQIGGVELSGNKTAQDLGLQPAGDYLKDGDVPTWAKQPQKPTYTPEEIGAQPKGDYATLEDIPEKLPNPNPLTIKGKTYDGSQPVEVEVSDGKTPVKGVDYFTEAEIQDVAEQAAALVPGGSGGGLKWELIGKQTLSEAVESVKIGSETNKYKALLLSAICGSDATEGSSVVWLLSNVGNLRTQATTVQAKNKCISQVFAQACGNMFTGTAMYQTLSGQFNRKALESLEPAKIVVEYDSQVLFSGIQVIGAGGYKFDVGDTLVLYGGS